MLAVEFIVAEDEPADDEVGRRLKADLEVVVMSTRIKSASARSSDEVGDIEEISMRRRVLSRLSARSEAGSGCYVVSAVMSVVGGEDEERWWWHLGVITTR